MMRPALHRRDDAPAGLFLSAEGDWYHDGDPVGHARTEALLHRSVAWVSDAPDATLHVTTGRDTLAFTCEAAPRVVLRVQPAPEGLTLHLAGGEVRRADPTALRLVATKAGGMAIALPDVEMWASLSREALRQIADLLDMDADTVVLPLGNARVPVGSTAQGVLARRVSSAR